VISTAISRSEISMRTLEEKLAAFKTRNRVVLTSLAWQRTPIPTASIWAAAVPEGHPVWELLRLNKALMHEPGFRAVRGEAGNWRLEVTLEGGNGEQPRADPTQSNLVAPVPEGLAYYPFQRVGIEFLSTRLAALLADEMGTGKTIQLAGLLNLLGQDLQRVLVVTPASVKRVWALELSKWLVRKVPIMLVKGATPLADLPSHGIWIVNYELLTKFRSALLREPWDLIALDEAHFIKNRSSLRTKACFGLARVAKRKILLTGTPLLNRPAELWTLLDFLAPAEWPNFYRFAHRYCAPFRSEWGWDFSGASNLEELNAKLRRSLMLRRLKKDVLSQLPPLTRALVPLDVGLGDLEELTRLAGLDPLKMPLEVDPLSIPLDCVAKIRHELGRLKVGAALAFILEQADSCDDKFVVFAHHRAVLDDLHHGLAGSGAVLVIGETPEADRAAAIERFQTDRSTRFFVGSIRAMGVGVTLSAASRVIFVEQDWTPSVLRQAEDRLHRISQTQAVLSQYLVVPDSIDVNVMRSVIAKIEVIERTIDAA
jgi:SWI/SNF-related matrix-associated actin-dependent regulator 1 of chromatin subfamily A